MLISNTVDPLAGPEPAGVLAQTFPVTLAQNSALPIVSGQLMLTQLHLLPGMGLSRAMFAVGGTGTTAAVEHLWCCLTDPDMNLLALTDDVQWSLLSGTTYSLPFTSTASGSSVQISEAGSYYMGLLIVTTESPTLIACGAGPNGKSNLYPPPVFGLSTSGMTTPPGFGFKPSPPGWSGWPSSVIGTPAWTGLPWFGVG